MVSIQTGLPVSTGITYRSSHISNKSIYQKIDSGPSIGPEIVQFRFQIQTDTRQHLNNQHAIFNFNQMNKEDKAALFYNDTPISELSADEAQELISADGYFGIDKTSQRIAGFVINGAGNDIDRLKAGREGVLKGFNEAEKAWGGTLPDISYKTLEKSLETIDKKIRDFGGSVIDLSS